MCDKICRNLVSWVFNTSLLVVLGVLCGQGLHLGEIQTLLVIVGILLHVGILVLEGILVGVGVLVQLGV